MFFLFLYTIPVGVEYYFKETKYIGATTFIAAAINVGTNYLFIKEYGYVAAAYTTLLSYVVMFALHWFIAKRIMLKHNIDPFFKFGSFAILIMIVIVFGYGVVLLNPYPILKYCIGIILFGMISFFTRKVWNPYVKAFFEKRNRQ